MPTFVYKEAPDVDFYIGWSTVVEAPVFAGTRTEVLERLTQQSDPWLREDAPHHPEQRMKRCDETGTTAMTGFTTAEGKTYPADGAWDDTGEIYEQRGTVKRADLFVLARRQAEDENADVSDLIEPFEHES